MDTHFSTISGLSRLVRRVLSINSLGVHQNGEVYRVIFAQSL